MDKLLELCNFSRHDLQLIKIDVEKLHSFYIRVRWVVNIQTWGYKISFILVKKLDGLQGNGCMYFVT